MPILREAASKRSTEGEDVLSLFMATSMDSISAYIFGIGNSTNFIQDRAFRSHWLEQYLARHNNHFWPQEFPKLTSLCRVLGLHLYPATADLANAWIREWNWKVCEATHDQILNGPGSEESANRPVVFDAMHAGIERNGEIGSAKSFVHSPLTPKRSTLVASEVLDHVLAGHETAGIALTYLSWHLSQSLPLQNELRKELLTLDQPLRIDQEANNGLRLPDPKALDSLPVLHAMVMETLRLHAPIPGPQPRQTPFPSSRIVGYEVPGGVRIAALAHTLHHNEEVFPQPHIWDHTRWLRPDNDEQLKQMKRHFWAFGSGGRMCIGSNFALNGEYNNTRCGATLT